MEMIRVQSKAIRAIGYDGAEKRLRVKFKSGDIYNFRGVPQYVHDELMAASSKGRYFNRHIKDRYPC